MSDAKNISSSESTPRSSSGRHRVDRLALWSSRTLGSRRRGDVTEPVSPRALALWSAMRTSTLH